MENGLYCHANEEFFHVEFGLQDGVDSLSQ